MIKKLNHRSSKRPTISHPSSLETQFLDIMKLLGGATSLDSILKCDKSSEADRVSPTSSWKVRTSSRMKNYLYTGAFSVN